MDAHRCCMPDCGQAAEHGIWPDPPRGPDIATEACEAHVGALLYDGINSVHPLALPAAAQCSEPGCEFPASHEQSHPHGKRV